MAKVLHKMRNLVTARAFSAWHTKDADRRKERDRARRCVALIKSRLLVFILDEWCTFVVEQKRLAEHGAIQLQKEQQREQIQMLASMLHAQREADADRKKMLLGRVVLRALCSTLARALDRSSDSCPESCVDPDPCTAALTLV